MLFQDQLWWRFIERKIQEIHYLSKGNKKALTRKKHTSLNTQAKCKVQKVQQHRIMLPSDEAEARRKALSQQEHEAGMGRGSYMLRLGGPPSAPPAAPRDTGVTGAGGQQVKAKEHRSLLGSSGERDVGFRSTFHFILGLQNV